MLRYVLAGWLLLSCPLALLADCPCTTAGPEACCCGRSCPCLEKAINQARREHKPLLLFVRQPVQDIPGCIGARVDFYPGQLQPGVIFGLPRQGEIIEVARRDSYPTKEWLCRRVQELQQEWAEVSTTACGFSLQIHLGRRSSWRLFRRPCR